MERLIQIIAIVLLVAFAGLGINNLNRTQHKLNIREIELKSASVELKELDLRYNMLNQRLDDSKKLNKQQLDELNKEKSKLENEKKELEKQLQAKREAKEKEKQAIANASRDLINKATGTATAYASSGSVTDIIIAAANKYGIDPNYALKIAKCESTYTPSSVNYNYWVDAQGTEYGTVGGKYHPSGLFQHVTLYWPARAAKYGYAGASVFDPVANANVTMGMWRDGSKGLWECN